jgi:hypothetical protein
VLLRGDIQHKNLWRIDLETGAERKLTNLATDFDIRDFDISPDGREVVLERVQGHSDVAAGSPPTITFELFLRAAEVFQFAFQLVDAFLEFGEAV